MTNDMKANYKSKYEKVSHASGIFDIKALGSERLKQVTKRFIPNVIPGQEVQHYEELTKRKLIKQKRSAEQN
jgi:hypothetical protein